MQDKIPTKESETTNIVVFVKGDLTTKQRNKSNKGLKSDRNNIRCFKKEVLCFGFECME